MEAVLEVLMNGGPMGMFAAYLIWSKNKQDQKLETMNTQFMERLDDIQSKHESQRQALEDKYDSKNEQVRERWLEVVKKVEGERDEVQKISTQEVQTLVSTVASIKEKVIEISNELRFKNK